MQSDGLSSDSERRRAQVKMLLDSRDWPALIEWARTVPGAFRILLSFQYERGELLCWRSIEGLAKIAEMRAIDDPGAIRQLLRHLFWSMNDESGGIGWTAPEAIGEILRNVPVLLEEFGPILCSFLRESPFERGVHSALSRIITLKPKLFAGLRADLIQSLNDPDQSIRGFALLALKGIGPRSPDMPATALLSDHAAFFAYDWEAGTMKSLTVSEITRQFFET